MSRIGIDTGGTFTDFIWVDAAGRLRLHKEPSTPDDPSRAVVDGLAASGAPEGADVVHGSTVATNALLQRRGAPTALIATEGFADVLAIGRQNRPDLYALVPQKPPPLVPRQWRFEVQERIGADGESSPLDEASLAAAVEGVAAAGVESVAVCLLFSFLRPEHEQRIGAALRAGGCPASTCPSRPTSCPNTASTSARRRRSSTPPSPRSWAAIWRGWPGNWPRGGWR